jgi:hypothetical protein
MLSRSSAICRLLVLVSCAFFALHARAANEAALLELWQEHIGAPTKYDDVIASCRAFATRNASDPLLPVVHGIEAWHHIAAGRPADGARLLEPYLSAPAGPITDGARAVAKGWFTRWDREKLKDALRLYYRKEIGFPKTLDQLASYKKLPAGTPVPLLDRFGKPWNYRLTGFQSVQGLSDQKYTLLSDALGETSDLQAATKLAYAARITVVPKEIVTTPTGGLAVKFQDSANGKTALVSVGTNSGELHVAFAGQSILVVCDHAHWKIYPKP